ncbi:MAG: S4 domain-containing protein [Nitrospinota bacterium]
MRVDLFLKSCRLVRRRAEARAMCEEGALLLNGRAARAGRELRVEDELELRTWRRVLRLRVVALPRKGAGRGEARACYQVLEERVLRPGAEGAEEGAEGEMDFLSRR